VNREMGTFLISIPERRTEVRSLKMRNGPILISPH
jgi:hypothetical protein